MSDQNNSSMNMIIGIVAIVAILALVFFAVRQFLPPQDATPGSDIQLQVNPPASTSSNY